MIFVRFVLACKGLSERVWVVLRDFDLGFFLWWLKASPRAVEGLGIGFYTGLGFS